MQSRTPGATRGRICFVSHDPGTQGAERAMLDMAKLLRDAGWQVMVLIPEGPGELTDMVADAGLEQKRMPFYYWMGPDKFVGRVYRTLVNMLAVPRLVSFFRKNRFDVIYTHSIAVGAPAIAARLAGCAHVWHLHEYGPYGIGEVKREFDLGDRITLGLAGWSKSVFVAVAHVIADTFAPRLPGAEMRVGYQPVPFDAATDSRDAAALEQVTSHKGPRIMYVGAVTETKRQEDAVRAMPIVLKEQPEAKLFLAGRVKSEYRAELDRMANELGVTDAIVYLDYLHNAPAFLGHADISLNCRLVEASPRVVVESMMAGSLVIAAGAGGNVESVTSETGLLYEPKDHEDLARKILWAIENPEQVRGIVETAKHSAIEARAMDVYAHRYVELIEDAIAKARSLRAG